MEYTHQLLTVTLASSSNLPEGYDYISKENRMWNIKEKRFAGASTEPVDRTGWFRNLKSKIYVSPGIKGYYYAGKNFSQVAISHEFLHASHLNSGLSNYKIYSERAASAYSLVYSKTYNMTSLYPIFRGSIGPYPSSYSFTHLFRLINMGIR